MVSEMADISARDFGRLEANIDNLGKGLTAMSATVTEIDRKVSDSPTRTEFAELVERISIVRDKHEKRFVALESINTARTSSIWSRIGAAADANVVAFLGKVIVIGFGAMIALYFLNTYTVAEKGSTNNTVNIEGEKR